MKKLNTIIVSILCLACSLAFGGAFTRFKTANIHPKCIACGKKYSYSAHYVWDYKLCEWIPLFYFGKQYKTRIMVYGPVTTHLSHIGVTLYQHDWYELTEAPQLCKKCRR